MASGTKGKPCKACGEVITPRGGMCSDCLGAYNTAYQHNYQPKRTAQIKQARLDDPERFKGYWNKKNAKIRAEMVAAYGGVCECCREGEEAFLTLEHKNRDGAAHRKSLSPSRNPRMVYADLKKRGWPTDAYGLMCFNCNMGSWKTGGVCPHKMVKADA